MAMSRQRGPRTGVSTRAVNHSHGKELYVKVHGVDPEFALVSRDAIDQAEEMEAQDCCCLLRPFAQRESHHPCDVQGYHNGINSKQWRALTGDISVPECLLYLMRAPGAVIIQLPVCAVGTRTGGAFFGAPAPLFGPVHLSNCHAILSETWTCPGPMARVSGVNFGRWTW